MRNCLLLLLLCGLLTDGLAQAGKKPVKKPAVKSATSKTAAVSPAVASSISKGKIVYTSTCLPCHQVDGLGVPNMNPPLTKTDYVLGDKLRLINILLKGLNEDVVINGDSYSNPMPPVSYLTDEQIADVLTYVRNSFGNKASAITKSEVEKARK